MDWLAYEHGDDSGPPAMTVELGDELRGGAGEDARLLPAFAMLEKFPVSVLSLDVFDTLLWRLVPEPTDAFLLLGQRLRDAGRLDPSVPPRLFARLRERAELRARARISTNVPPEVSLEAIYAELPLHLFGGLDGTELADMEVDLDRSITFPDLEVTRLARFAQDKLGARIVLVSDIYYSSAQLRALLERDTFEGLTFDAVFTSSEHGVGKASGLYELVLEALGVSGDEVLHVGDNEEADVRCAADHGIATVHLDKYPHSLRTVVEREGLLRSTNGTVRKATKAIDPVAGDMGLTALRAKAVSRSEGAHMPAAVAPYWRFGAAVLGPVFTAFSEWVHAKTAALGADTVYCVMREGEFLGRLVDGARHHLGSTVRSQPLWLSRQVCARATLFEASADELLSLLQRRRAPTLREFCDSLGIGLSAVPELFNDGEGRLDDPDLRQRALSALSRRPDLKATIVANSAELRKRLVDYFVGVVGDAERVVLVDLGWGATIQAHLQRALDGAGLQIDTHGLYLLTTDGAADRMLEGVRAEGFLACGGLPEEAMWVIRSPEILEQVCMVDQGSLVDIGPDGGTVHAPVSQRPTQMLQRNAVQRGIAAFQHEWARYTDLRPAEQRDLLERGGAMLLNVLLRFVVSPTEEEANLFRAWHHEEDFGSKEAAEAVIADDLATSLRYMTPGQLLDLPMSRVYWPFGMAAVHNRPLGLAARALADGGLPAEAFEPVEPIQAEVEVDAGAGYRPLLLTTAGPNNNGLCFLRAHLSEDGVRGVRVRLGGGPAVVRLDSLRVAMAVRGRPEPVVAEVQWPDDFRQLSYHRCSPITDNLLFGARNAPEVEYRCPPELGGEVYGADVELAFAWLPISPIRGLQASRLEVVMEASRRVKGKLHALWRRAEGVASERAGPTVRA